MGSQIVTPWYGLANSGYGHFGPFTSSTGKVFVILKNSGENISVHGSTTPETGSWSLQDDSNKPTAIGSGTLYRLWGAEDRTNDVLHIITANGSSASSPSSTWYHTFNMSTSAWAIKDELVTSVGNGTAITVAPGKDPIVVMEGENDKEMGTSYYRVDWTYRIGTNNWATPIALDHGGTVYWRNPGCYIHPTTYRRWFTYANQQTAYDVYTRYAADGSTTLSTEDDTTFTLNQNYPVRMAGWNDSGTEVLMVMLWDSASSAFRSTTYRNQTQQSVVTIQDSEEWIGYNLGLFADDTDDEAYAVWLRIVNSVPNFTYDTWTETGDAWGTDSLVAPGEPLTVPVTWGYDSGNSRMRAVYKSNDIGGWWYDNVFGGPAFTYTKTHSIDAAVKAPAFDGSLTLNSYTGTGVLHHFPGKGTFALRNVSGDEIAIFYYCPDGLDATVETNWTDIGPSLQAKTAGVGMWGWSSVVEGPYIHIVWVEDDTGSDDVAVRYSRFDTDDYTFTTIDELLSGGGWDDASGGADICNRTIELESYTWSVTALNTEPLYGGTAATAELNQKLAQAFQVTTGGQVNYVELWVMEEFAKNLPTDGLQVKLTTTRDGTPLATSKVVTAADVGQGAFIGTGTTNPRLTRFYFPTPPTLTTSTTYYLEIERTGDRDEGGWFTVGYDTTSGYTSGARWTRDSNSWSSEASFDYWFRVVEVNQVAIWYSGNTTPTHQIDLKRREGVTWQSVQNVLTKGGVTDPDSGDNPKLLEGAAGRVHIIINGESSTSVHKWYQRVYSTSNTLGSWSVIASRGNTYKVTPGGHLSWDDGSNWQLRLVAHEWIEASTHYAAYEWYTTSSDTPSWTQRTNISNSKAPIEAWGAYDLGSAKLVRDAGVYVGDYQLTSPDDLYFVFVEQGTTNLYYTKQTAATGSWSTSTQIFSNSSDPMVAFFHRDDTIPVLAWQDDEVSSAYTHEEIRLENGVSHGIDAAIRIDIDGTIANLPGAEAGPIWVDGYYYVFVLGPDYVVGNPYNTTAYLLRNDNPTDMSYISDWEVVWEQETQRQDGNFLNIILEQHPIDKTIIHFTAIEADTDGTDGRADYYQYDTSTGTTSTAQNLFSGKPWNNSAYIRAPLFIRSDGTIVAVYSYMVGADWRIFYKIRSNSGTSGTWGSEQAFSGSTSGTDYYWRGYGDDHYDRVHVLYTGTSAAQLRRTLRANDTLSTETSTTYHPKYTGHFRGAKVTRLTTGYPTSLLWANISDTNFYLQVVELVGADSPGDTTVTNLNAVNSATASEYHMVVIANVTYFIHNHPDNWSYNGTPGADNLFGLVSYWRKYWPHSGATWQDMGYVRDLTWTVRDDTSQYGDLVKYIYGATVCDVNGYPVLVTHVEGHYSVPNPTPYPKFLRFDRLEPAPAFADFGEGTHQGVMGGPVEVGSNLYMAALDKDALGNPGGEFRGKRMGLFKASGTITQDSDWSYVSGSEWWPDVHGDGGMFNVTILKDGTDLHVIALVALNRGSATSSWLEYHFAYKKFDTVTGEYVGVVDLSSENVAVGVNGAYALSAVVRSTGEIVAGVSFQNATNDFTIYYTRYSTSAGWADVVAVSTSTTTNKYGPQVILGASDRVHFLYKVQEDYDIRHRALNSSNALQTDTQLHAGTQYPYFLGGQGLSFGTSPVRCYGFFTTGDAGGTNFTLNVVHFDSADTPTFTIEQPGDAYGLAYSTWTSYISAGLAYKDGIVHLLYFKAAGGIWWDQRTDPSGSWGTDADISADTSPVPEKLNVNYAPTRDALVIQTFENPATSDYSYTHYEEVTLAPTTVEHVIDAILVKVGVPDHDIDALLADVIETAHNIDAMLVVNVEKDHQIDFWLKDIDVTRQHAIDFSLSGGNIVDHGIDAELFTSSEPDHQIDFWLKAIDVTRDHDIDAELFDTIVTDHNIDAELFVVNTRFNQIDFTAAYTYETSHSIDFEIGRTHELEITMNLTLDMTVEVDHTEKTGGLTDLGFLQRPTSRTGTGTSTGSGSGGSASGQGDGTLREIRHKGQRTIKKDST